jgi:hypothetical protein
MQRLFQVLNDDIVTINYKQQTGILATALICKDNSYKCNDMNETSHSEMMDLHALNISGVRNQRTKCFYHIMTPASYRGDPGWIPGQVILWWTKWHWGRFSPST